MTHKYDAYQKVLRVIKSCKNRIQISSTYNVISNFNRLYDDDILKNKLHIEIGFKRRSIINNEEFRWRMKRIISK